MSSRHNAPTALGFVTAFSISRSAAAVAAAALAILAGGAATCVVGRADASEAQPKVRLAAATLNASVAQGCGSDHDMMSVPEVLQMVIVPSTPNEIRLADENKDNYLCVTVASGRQITDFVDNREESGGSDEGSNGGNGGNGGDGGDGDGDGGMNGNGNGNGNGNM